MDEIEMGHMEDKTHLMGGMKAGGGDTGAHPDVQNEISEERVGTSFGNLTVGVVGDRRKPALLTYHDIGLNANSCFQSFFQFSDMAEIADKFCIYHVNAPGQEEDASTWPESQPYPSMDDLAGMILSVLEHFKIKHCIGLGLGAGANILLRFALKNPKKVEALILVNTIFHKCGWIEWAYQKMNVKYLRERAAMTNLTLDYLMWHHFGSHQDTISNDLLLSYRQYFTRLGKPRNLAGFMESFIWRTPVLIDPDKQPMDCPILQVVGGGSPHIGDTVELNSKLDHTKSEWMKVSESSGMCLEERPDAVAEAVLLFLQGIGYFPGMSHYKWVQARKHSVVESPPLPAAPASKGDDSGPVKKGEGAVGEVEDPSAVCA